MKLQCNFLIAGAGIIGLTVARELLAQGNGDILIIDKEPSLGRHASGRNSGVLHAGIYYTADSLKAKFCLEGNRLMKSYCREKNLPLLECGKVIVTRNFEELDRLDELKRRGDAAGAEVRILDEKELKEIEPHARTSGKALYSRETAAIDSLSILSSLQNDLLSSGKVRINLSTAYLQRKSTNTVETTAGPVEFKLLINTAGAYADKIARAFGAGGQYRILPFKGTYRDLKPERSHLVRGNIYPVPDLRNPFLGVHFSRSVNGAVSIGPTAMPAWGRENYKLMEGLGYETASILFRDLVMLARNSAFRANAIAEIGKLSTSVIYRDARQLVPELQLSDLKNSDRIGIRPQLVDWPARRLVMDYVIEKAENSLHILNTVSPGFTSSMAFAKHIVTQINLP